MNNKPTIIRSKRKTLCLVIDPSKGLIVKAPFRVSEKHIELFILQKQNWIEKNLEKVKNKKPLKKEFINNELFLFLGKEYPLLIIDTEYPLFEFDDKFLLSKYHVAQSKSLLTNWYKKQATTLIQERLNNIAITMNLKPNLVRINSATSQFGSCNYKNNISFTWRLIMAPIDVIDYVIIHELAHIVHKNHSKTFWKEVATYCPNFKNHKKWLVNNNHLLYI